MSLLLLSPVGWCGLGKFRAKFMLRIMYRAPETRRIIRGLPTVMDYADKIHQQFFPDYEHWDEGKGEK